MIAKVSNFFDKAKSFFAFDIFKKEYIQQNTEKDINQQHVIQNEFVQQPIQQQPQNQSFTIDKAHQELKEAISKAPMRKIAPGVYAGEYKGYQVSTIKINEIEFLEYTFDVNGRKIKIKVPKGETPPSQETVEKIFSK
ncbi:MAG: hypothetical protein QXG86_04085 [Candidatus Woesearchaeota archaeon]